MKNYEAAGAGEENKEMSKEERDAFLADFIKKPEGSLDIAHFAAARPQKSEVSHLMNDALRADRERSGDSEAWEKELQLSKEKAQVMAQALPALEEAFKKYTDLKLVIKASDNAENLEVSVPYGEIDPVALGDLQNFLDQCVKIRIPGRFYNSDADSVQFAGLFSRFGTYRDNPAKIFELIKGALESAQEVK